MHTISLLCNLYMGLMSHTSYKNNIIVRLPLQSYTAVDDLALVRPNRPAVFLRTYE